MNEVIVKLTREEALSCIVALESKRKLWGWGRDALAKLLKAMGMKTREELGIRVDKGA